MSEKKFWHSKKFWASVVGAAVPVLNHFFDLGLSPEVVIQTIGPIGAYILGQGLADFGKNKSD